MKFLIVATIAALAVAHDHRSCSSSSSSMSCACDELPHHHHHHDHPHRHHEHPHHDAIDCGHHDHHHHHDIVVNDMTCGRMATNMVAPKEVKPVEEVVVEPVVVVVPNTNPVYTVDPNGQAPYPNGETVDVFFSCNDNKAFIAKRGNGIYTEIYNLNKAGQTKPKMN